MESKDEARDQLRAAERAAAATYVDYPKDPWWFTPGFGVLAVLLVVMIKLQEQPQTPGWIATLLMVLILAGSLGALRFQRNRRGTLPSGRAPREVNRVLWGFILGAVVVAVTLFVLADLAPLWLAVPAAFLLTSGGLVWFGHAYDRAATQVRKRLA